MVDRLSTYSLRRGWGKIHPIVGDRRRQVRARVLGEFEQVSGLELDLKLSGHGRQARGVDVACEGLGVQGRDLVPELEKALKVGPPFLGFGHVEGVGAARRAGWELEGENGLKVMWRGFGPNRTRTG